MRQYAPDPLELFELVARAEYRPGWTFWIGDEERDPESSHGESAGGLTLEITTLTIDTHDHENERYRVRHIFPVPAATYNRESWTAWLFERCCDVERHEAAEFFAIRRESTERDEIRVGDRVIARGWDGLDIHGTVVGLADGMWRIEAETGRTYQFERGSAVRRQDEPRNVDFPFQPVHAPHWDPYMLVTVPTTELARDTRFDGSVAHQ